MGKNIDIFYLTVEPINPIGFISAELKAVAKRIQLMSQLGCLQQKPRKS